LRPALRRIFVPSTRCSTISKRILDASMGCRDGPMPPRPSSAPAHRAANRKHAFLARSGALAVGLLDLIDGYPSAGTVCIGLLAIRQSAQGAGLGRALYREAERFARDELGARVLRLAVVATNPVIGFWTRMGFRPTGETKPFCGESVTSLSILMEKHL
jgi:ribosomal protein S18 acetylase RimI-like enzyme